MGALSSRKQIRKVICNLKNGIFKFSRLQICLLVIPVVLFLMMTVVPTLFALAISLTNWNGGKKKDFIGLANYIKLFKDPIFWTCCKNNVILIAITVVFQIIIAFVLAVVISSRSIKFKEFHRNAIFIPVVISPLIVGLLFWMIYDINDGLLNIALRSLHLENLICRWLDDPKVALYSVGAAIVWQYVGLYMVIFLAGLQSISGDIYEAAEMDGATGFKQLIYIKMPLLSSTFKVALILAISGGLKLFEHIYIMTGGGPGRATNVLALYAYEQSFTISHWGYGSAISVSILVFGVLLVGGLNLLSNYLDRRKGI